MQKPPDTLFNVEDFTPELRDLFTRPPINPRKIILAAIPIKNPDEHPGPVPAGTDRRSITFTDGKEFWHWKTDSLRSLFRGDRQPPVLGDCPTAYNDSFILFDLHALEISKFFGTRRDSEMREIHSSLRRRPDGRSLGFVHDYMWQAAALILGTRPLSQAEFEAITARLERSCRTFEQGPTSRNYVAALRESLGREDGSLDADESHGHDRKIERGCGPVDAQKRRQQRRGGVARHGAPFGIRRSKRIQP